MGMHTSSFIFKTPLQYVCACGKENMVRYLLENGADPTIKDKTGRDALDIARHLKRDGVVKILQEYQTKENERQKMEQQRKEREKKEEEEKKESLRKEREKGEQEKREKEIQQRKEKEEKELEIEERKKKEKLYEMNFDELLQCQDGKVSTHRMLYSLCPAMNQKNLINYKVNEVESLRHYLYTNELQNHSNITEYVHLYEMSLLLNVPELSNRILKVLPQVLNVNNFEEAFKAALQSDLNVDNMQFQSLHCFVQNFILEHKQSLVLTDTLSKNVINLVLCISPQKSTLSIGNDDCTPRIEALKNKLWTTKEHSDLTLLCQDKISVQCHKAIVCGLPLFAKMDSSQYTLNVRGSALQLFLEKIYTGKLDLLIKSTDVLAEVYELADQNGLQGICIQITTHLKSILNYSNCIPISEFYFSSNLKDQEFLGKLQDVMKSAPPEKFGEFLNQMRSSGNTKKKNLVMEFGMSTLSDGTIDFQKTMQFLNKNKSTGKGFLEMQDIEILEHAKRGSDSDIYEGKYKKTLPIMVKKIPKNPKSQDPFNQEVGILKKLQHSCFVEFFGYSEDKHHYYMIFEKMDCDLHDYLFEKKNQLTYMGKLIVLKRVAQALEKLHSLDIVHRDLKPHNILVKKENGVLIVKLADFGISKEMDGKSGRTTTFGGGTLWYVAPEILEEEKFFDKSDSYSLGIMAYQIMFEKASPYDEKMTSLSVMKFYSQILNGTRPTLLGEDAKFDSFLQQCWDGDVNKRLSSKEIVAKITGFLKEIDSKQVTSADTTSLKELLDLGVLNQDEFDKIRKK
jgi:tRNA A-37 threonylcarbamoyl transferase component Bud32